MRGEEDKLFSGFRIKRYQGKVLICIYFILSLEVYEVEGYNFVNRDVDFFDF